jgi:hypothetical protein
VAFLKASVPTVGWLPRKETERILLLPPVLNALSPILVTELGIVILVKAEQFANVLASMLVKAALVGRLTLESTLHPAKAELPILVTEFGITILGNA